MQAARQSSHCTPSISQQFQRIQSVARQFPAGAAFRHKSAARVALLLGLVDGEKLKLRFAFKLRSGPRNQFEWNGIEVERDFIPRHAFSFSFWIGPDQRGITFQPGKFVVRTTTRQSSVWLWTK